MEHNLSEDEGRTQHQRNVLSSLPNFDTEITTALDRDKIAEQAALSAQQTMRIDVDKIAATAGGQVSEAELTTAIPARAVAGASSSEKTAFLPVREVEAAMDATGSPIPEAAQTVSLNGARELAADVSQAQATEPVAEPEPGVAEPEPVAAEPEPVVPVVEPEYEPPQVPQTEPTRSHLEVALEALAEPVADDVEAEVLEPEVIPLTTDPVAQGVYTYEPITAQEDDKTERRKRRIGGAKLAIAVVLSLACVAGLVYAGVGYYFTTHFMPNTTVNGEDVSGMSVEELSAYVTSIGRSYKTHVSGDGLDLTIAGPDIDFVYDGEAYGNDAASQIDPWNWPAIIGKSHAFEVQKGISYSEEKLNAAVGAAVNKINDAGDPPTNATMTYDKDSHTFVIVPDALGTQINVEAVLPLVNDTVATMQGETTIGEEQLIQPTITKDNETLTSTVSNLNTVLDQSVTLRIAGADVTTIDRDLLASWFILDDQLGMHVSHDDIQTWAQGALSEQYDTIGQARTYTRPDGKQVQVDANLSEYSYGWCIDGAGLADTLATNLSNYVTGSVDVPMKMSASSYNPGGQEWPNRYIDVDLSEQYVRMYDDSSNIIWESNCVSGNPIYGGGTMTGVFTIFSKASPMELVGRDYDGDGEPDYRTPVDYWMPFDGGEGLHDASWRSVFGSNIYMYDGSHGCVNLPYSKAQELYGITNIGDVVIVHW